MSDAFPLRIINSALRQIDRSTRSGKVRGMIPCTEIATIEEGVSLLTKIKDLTETDKSDESYVHAAIALVDVEEAIKERDRRSLEDTVRILKQKDSLRARQDRNRKRATVAFYVASIAVTFWVLVEIVMRRRGLR